MEPLRLLVYFFPSIFLFLSGWIFIIPGCGKQKKKEPKKVGQSAASVANPPPPTKTGPQQGTVTKAPPPTEGKKDAAAAPKTAPPPQKSPANPDDGKKSGKDGKEKEEVRNLFIFIYELE